MKRLFISLTTLLTFVIFSNCFGQVKSKPKSMQVEWPPKDPSAGFMIGKAAYAKMIIEMWKDWDDNAFDRHDYMADSVTLYLPDGVVVKGKEANLEGAKKYRGSLASAKSTIFACISLNNPGRKEEAVAIWGEEEDTMPDGKVEKKGLHEVWWFNKAGKITAMRQWTAKFGE